MMCILHDDWQGRIKSSSEITMCEDCKNKSLTREEEYYRQIGDRKI